MNGFIETRLWLEQLSPSAPWIALTVASFVGTWAMRRFAPTLWVTIAAWGPPGGTIGHITQALPSVVASAVIAGFGTGDLGGALKGALCSLGAPLLHHLAKAAPQVPYRGALGKAVDGPTSRRLVADAVKGGVDSAREGFEKL